MIKDDRTIVSEWVIYHEKVKSLESIKRNTITI